MNREDLIEAVANDSEITKAMAKRVLTATLEQIQAAVARGDKVSLTGFGIFSATTRGARMGRNPKTGEPIPISASTTPKFTPGKGFRDAVS